MAQDQHPAWLGGGNVDATNEDHPDWLTAPPTEGSSAIRRLVADPAISLAKGVIGAGEGAVGLADLVSGGHAGKGLHDLTGFDPKAAKATLDEYMTPEQRAANEKVQAADGFVDTVSTAIQNPSTIAHSALESLPSMLGPGAAVKAVAPKLSAIAAGAIGEGIITAGQNAEGVRQESPDQLLSGKQAASQALAGVITGGIAHGAGKFANRMGIGDIDTVLAGGPAGKTSKGSLRRMAEGGLSEGVFEELPQSTQEQLLQNYALDRPLTEGVGNAAAMGMLTGAAMGGGVAGLLNGEPIPPGTTQAGAAGMDQANAGADQSLADYAGLNAPPAGLIPAVPSVIVPPSLGGAAAVAPEEKGKSGQADQTAAGEPNFLRSYSTQDQAQGALDKRADRDRLSIIPHPRVDGKFAVVSKSQMELDAMDAKANAGSEAQTRNATVASEEEAASAESKQMDALAHEAATSPLNKIPMPTEAQIQSGNYKKGKVTLHGMDVAIENPAGSVRSGVTPEGKPWSTKLTHHYGYIKGTVGADKDHVDVFLTPQAPHATMAWVIDQKNTDGSFDEHKVVLGPDNVQAAKEAYMSNYQPGWNGFGAMTAMTMSQFKSWVKAGKTHEALAYVEGAQTQDNQQAATGDVAQTELVPAQAQKIVPPAQDKAAKLRAQMEAKTRAATVASEETAATTEAAQTAKAEKTAPKPAKTAKQIAAEQADTDEAAQNELAPAQAQSTAEILADKNKRDEVTARLKAGREAKAAAKAKRAAAFKANLEAAAAKKAGGEVKKSNQRATDAMRAKGELTADQEITDVSRDQLPNANEVPKGAMSKQLFDSLTRLAKLFGKNVQIFSGPITADGFVIDNKTIYLNVNSQIAHAAVMGHELLHMLKHDVPQAYAALARVIKSSIPTEQWDAFEKYYNDPSMKGTALLEEAVADLMGNRFIEPQFWTDVFVEVEKQHGPLRAKMIIRELSQAIVRIINKVINALGGSAFKTDQFVAGDMKAVKAALVKATAEYLRELKSRGDAPTEQLGTKFSRRDADFTDVESRTTVSTTVPKPSEKKGRTSNPITEKWVIDTDDMRVGKKHMAAAIEAISTYNTVLTDPTQGEGVLDVLRKVVVANLLKLHDMVPAEVRARARLWYDGANVIANDWSSLYGVSVRQAAGVLAVFSPQMDWFKNVSLAERAIVIAKKQRETAWSSDMTAWVASYVESAATLKDRDDRLRLLVDAKRLEGKTFKYMSLPDQARFVRVFDETYHERNYRLVTPEGGFGDYVTKGVEDENGGLEDASITWGSFATIEKALSILHNGSFRNVSEKLGDEHKVRNFFNNIIDPGSADGHVTIDTHAVAAALFKALSGKSIEVSHNFGTTPKGLPGAGQTAETGASGTYGLFADAYREAAAQRGILAREMQSITWEAIRSLFPAGAKKQIQPKVNAVWDKFKTGEITRTEAEARVLALSGGLRPMQWEGSSSGTPVSRGGVSFNHTKTKPRLLAPANTKEKIVVSMSAYTDSIPALRRLRNLAAKGDDHAHRLLQAVALDAAKEIMRGTSAKITADNVTGVYGGVSEPSLQVVVAFNHAERNVIIARLKIFADTFNQEQVHVLRAVKEAVGHQYADGSYATPIYRWDLVQSLNAKEMVKVIRTSGLYGLTFGDTFVTAYYVGNPTDTGAIDEFKINVKSADVAIGSRSAGLKQGTARLWPYGDRGDGAIGWPGVPSGVSGEPGIRAESVRVAKQYVAGLKLSTRRVDGASDEQSRDGATGEVAATDDSGRGKSGRGSSARSTDGAPTNSRSTQALQGRLTPLPGAPSVPGFHGPDPRLVSAAEQYARDNGIALNRQAEYVAVDEDRANRLAAAYEAMPHAPNDPVVKAAYADLIKQTTAQYEALTKAGYKFWFINIDEPSNQEYVSTPWNAMRDIRATQTMGVFPTTGGFGSGDEMLSNPLEAPTGLRWPVGSANGTETAPVLANDLFRAVHDAFGHGLEGAGFRAQGEENAWQAHSRLFTGPALHALTSETRGQNSWLNYGPHAVSNQTATTEDTVFADQKTGLLPEWAWTEGRVGDMQTSQGLVGDVKLSPGRATGVHYSKEQRDHLTSNAYGTGAKGAEAARIAEATDPRLKHRIYFYVNGGRGINPEDGVGPHAHLADLTNIYDMDADPRDLHLGRNANDFESAVLDAGFDGYMSPSAGIAVQLGPRSTRVKYAGMTTPTVPQVENDQPGPRTAAGRAIAARRDLPDGQMTGAAWKARLPEMDLSHLQDDEKYYKSALVPVPKRDIEEHEKVEARFSRGRAMTPPKNTIVGYKLFPLFIGKNQPTKVGEWIAAQHIPTKGFAERPGWHAGVLPTAPHLRTKDGLKAADRVWAEVEIPADVDWQSKADKSGTRDIRDKVPKNGHYRFKTNKMQGGAWIIGGALKVNRVLSDADVADILIKAGELDAVGPETGVKLSTTRQQDAFADDFATKTTTITDTIAVSTKGDTEEVERSNVNSAGRQISNTKSGLRRFWDWYAGSPEDNKGNPLVLYHSTTGDISTFETMRETTNVGMFGAPFKSHRAGIFFTPNKIFAEEYSEGKAGANVMQTYVRMQQPADFRKGMSPDLERALEANGINTRAVLNLQYDWEMFEEEYGGPEIVAALKKAGYDGAIINEDDSQGKSQDTYVAFDPEQIKSATGNQGSWNETNPDIRMSRQRMTPEELHAAAEQIRMMNPDKRDDIAPWDMPGGYRAFLLYEAQKLLPKPTDMLRKVTERNSFALHTDFDSIANVDGVHYGINKYEDPDEPDDDTKFVYAYERLDDDSLKRTETTTDQKDELFAEMRNNNAVSKLSTKRADVTDEELRLDAAADNATRALDDFKRKHSSYFEFSHRSDPVTGAPYPVRVDLDREATRLHQAAIAANKAAADAEYNNRDKSAPDIQMSRQRLSDAIANVDLRNNLLNGVRNQVADIISPSQGFNLWHKTVGTQFHKASINAEFKKVFDLGQKFLDDLQLFAIRAEDKAPTIFPRELLKLGLSSADNALLGNLLAEGTLMNGPNPHDGVVFTDAQLRAKGLTDAQIVSYRQARAAIDESLNGLAGSEMAQHMRIQGAPLTEVEQIAKADLSLADKYAEFSKLVDALELANPGKDYSETRKHLKGILSTTTDLQTHGYAPLSRFGAYNVTAWDAAGKVEFFTMTDSMAEARVLERQLKQDPNVVRTETNETDTESYKVFAGITPDTLELFAKHAAAGPVSDLMQEYLHLAVANRSTMKRMIKRGGIAGYSSDATRTLASFITSNGRRSSTNLHMSNLGDAVTEIKQGGVKNEAAKLFDYLKNPGEEAAALRGFLFFNFLGGSIASGIVNMTQPVMMTLPYLSKYGVAKAGVAMTKALADTSSFLRGKQVSDPNLQQALMRAKSEGHINPQEIYQMMAAANTGNSSFLGHKFTRVWGANFAITEMFNRTITFSAAYQLAKDSGSATPYEDAVLAINETQGLYNKGNRPDWARGAVGSTLFTFKQYSIAYMEFMKRMWGDGTIPKKQFVLAAGLLLMAAGANGAPGADDLDDIIDTIGNWLGYATNSKRWKREFLTSVFGKELGEFAMIGISKYLPIDVQARLGLGNLIPGTGLLNPTKTDKAREVTDVLGPAGGLAKSIGDATEGVAKGDYRGAALSVLPTAMRNAYQAAEMWDTGKYKDRGNKTVTDVTKGDALAKAAGFQPAKVATIQRSIREAQSEADIVTSKQTEFMTRIANAIADGDNEERTKALGELRLWNENNPDYKVRLNPSAVQQAVKLRRMSKDVRFIKQIPKTIRARIREEIAQ